MTLELTTQQLHDLRQAVKSTASARQQSAADLWDAPAPAREALKENSQRLNALADLIEKTSIVILYQP